MLWLDQVLSTPTIGLQFERWFLGNTEVLDAVRPVLEDWQREGREVELSSDALTRLVVKTSDGLAVTIDAEQLVVQFTYRGHLEERPAQVPALRYPIEPQPFSQLIERVRTATERMASALHRRHPRDLRRFGLVASCRCEGAALPPGVAAWLAHQGRPWGGTPLRCQSTVVAKLAARADGGSDRCHHTLDQSEDRADDLRCVLDWQRQYAAGHRWPKSDAKLAEALQQSCEDAVSYFKRFGEGDLNYDLA